MPLEQTLLPGYRRGESSRYPAPRAEKEAVQAQREKLIDPAKPYKADKSGHRRNPRNYKGEQLARDISPLGPVADDELAPSEQRRELPFKVSLRAVVAEDYPFILNAWMTSYRGAHKDMRNEPYYQGQQNLIAEIAKRRNLIVACDEETPAFIVGFVAGVPLEDGRLLLDYVYVKLPYRQFGVARMLVAALGANERTKIVATHRPRAYDQVFFRYIAEFNPYFNMIGFSGV